MANLEITMEDSLMIEKKIIVYTDGVYDLFHIGHLNMLHNAASLCDRLIVGVHSDSVVQCPHKLALTCVA
jgi:cytidyltransferase-like protein